MIAHRWQERIRRSDPVLRSGRVCGLGPNHIIADGPAVPLGTVCRVSGRAGREGDQLAEVVALDRTKITLVPFETGVTVTPGAAVVALPSSHDVAVGDAFIGRAIDPLGRPIDGKPMTPATTFSPLYGQPPAPLERTSPKAILGTGIRAIDGLLPLARGQRVGIFAAAGVGKTSLVHQLAAQVEVDVVVLALIGERGREVEACWSALPPAVSARTTMVAATSDRPAVVRVRAGHYAMALAEYERARGRNVLLLLDSVTRFAMAIREIGLAAGEPPTVRAYTPNVFAEIPRLVERAGALRAGGSISVIMTVLGETDEVDDPLCEMMKSLLDGHIVLSRTLAEQGHFPAIDVSRSVSRQANGLHRREVANDIRQIAAWISAFEQSRMLRQAGLYVAGSDAAIDDAVARNGRITEFLRQPADQRASVDQIVTAIGAIVRDAA